MVAWPIFEGFGPTVHGSFGQILMDHWPFVDGFCWPMLDGCVG